MADQTLTIPASDLLLGDLLIAADEVITRLDRRGTLVVVNDHYAWHHDEPVSVERPLVERGAV